MPTLADNSNSPPRRRMYSKHPDGRPPDLAELRADFLSDIKRFCPRDLANDVEDLAQEATIRAQRVLERPDGEKLWNWGYCHKIASGVVIDALRQRRGMTPVTIDRDDLIPSMTPGPEREFLSRELRDAIVSCLREMKPLQARAVWLSLEETPTAEICRLLGCSKLQVYNLVYRGRRQLYAKLAARGFHRDEI